MPEPPTSNICRAEVTHCSSKHPLPSWGAGGLEPEPEPVDQNQATSVSPSEISTPPPSLSNNNKRRCVPKALPLSLLQLMFAVCRSQPHGVSELIKRFHILYKGERKLAGLMFSGHEITMHDSQNKPGF